jgi:hypothetical protein
LSKVGFIAKVKSKGRTYIYLRKSYWEDNKPKNRNVYSFGNQAKATESIVGWINGEEPFPKELSEMGYSVRDAEKWIHEIEK